VEVSPARIGVVTGGADTLANGSEVTVGRPTPGGTYRWFLPRGARVRITGRRGDQLRAQLDTTTAWLPASAVTLGDAAGTPGTVPSTRAAAAVSIAPAAGWVDVRIAADGAPFLVQADSDRLLLSVHDRTAGPLAPPAPDALLAGIRWSSTDPAQLELRFARPLWGYKAFYAQNGDLVLRVRRPPAIDPAAPLRGIRIVVDPGHPPAGAIGPTGLTEAEANLTIGLELAKQLRARGAEVLLTRTTGSAVSITDRVEMAVRSDAQLLVSVHNNAFAEGVNPFRNHGTSAYYFHPFSAGLSQALDREIASATLIPDLGSKWSNLALVRPTWMPSALTESLYMLIPEQEAALRDPAFVERLAAAHVRGMEEFLRNAARR
jgi:N-acetylmuramoyl-L-alanine amidase